MGADLTTENRVLGDHDDEFKEDDEKVLRTIVSCKANLSLISKYN